MLCNVLFCMPVLKLLQHGVSIDPVLAHEIILDQADGLRFLILDVQSNKEFTEAHLAHAVNVDFYKPGFDSLVYHLDTTAVYLVYCTRGIRGALAVEKMRRAGYRKTFNLEGGIKAWTAHKFPVESGRDQ
jgi:rhodanese-related sulfurtransferase